MSLKTEVLDLLDKINNSEDRVYLNENCSYLEKGVILQEDRLNGDTRYPYSKDGLTLWAYNSGNIQISESNFFLSPNTIGGKEPCLSFFGGIKNDTNDLYNYISITGAGDNYFSSKIKKYVVYTSYAAYYIKVLNDVIFATRVSVSNNKEILYSNIAINNSNNNKDIYLSSFMNYLVMHGETDNEETKWFKRCEKKSYGALFTGLEDLSREIHLTNFAIIKRVACKNTINEITTSRGDFCGGKNNQLAASTSLIEGKFNLNKNITVFSETAAYGDIIKANISKGDYLQVDYMTTTAFNKEDLNKLESQNYSFGDNDKIISTLKEYYDNYYSSNSSLEINFKGFNNGLDDDKFNCFIDSVIKQVDYCAKAKNSSMSLLGIRDMYQMIEAALIWNPKLAREKILSSLNYIDLDGRAPRQFSIPTGDENPRMDNRPFIDQGQWIISTLYTYLSFTNDWSILDENCTFCNLIGRNGSKLLKESSSVYDHLLRIMNFLINNIDEDTGCLKTLFGDWNDAVDGLGTTSKEGKEYGNGVSMMATLHFYKNLKEFQDISNTYLKTNDDSYLKLREAVGNSINKYGFVSNGNETKCLHGWGENRSYFIGSFDDCDHKDRVSSTSHSFLAISGLVDNSSDKKSIILNAFDHLDSKYGYKTFDKFFDKDGKKAGRIINLPGGTAENAATYIHACVFAIKSLFMLDEGEKAWEQIKKIIPITHDHVTASPFVMPNSYAENPSLELDGESMNDWYTGSSNTLIKALIFDALGIRPNLDNTVSITPPTYLPCKEVSVSILIKGKKLNLRYINEGNKISILSDNKLIQNNIISL